MDKAKPNNEMIACLKCDTLALIPKIEQDQSAICPCCGAILFSRKKRAIERTMALALAGLLLFFPALTLPIIGIRSFGLYNEASLLQCIIALIDSDFYLVALCLFMFTVAIPFIRLFTTFYLSLQLSRNLISPRLVIFFRSYHKLDHWAMVSVFFLGIVISIYKLQSMANLSVGGGLICLLLLLLCSTFVSNTLDHHYVWQRLEKALAPTR